MAKKKSTVARITERMDGSGLWQFTVDMTSGSRFVALMVPLSGGDATDDEINTALNDIVSRVRKGKCTN